MATLTLAGESFEMVKPSALTFAEARSFESVTGYQFGDLLARRKPAVGSAATSQALMWLSMKRVKPELKFSDLDGLTLDDIQVSDDEEDEADEGGEAAQDPTPGEDSQPVG